MDEVKRLWDIIDELLDIIQVECCYSVFCPCCGEVEVCLPDCSYADDSPDDAEKMARLRRIIGGRPD